MELIAGLLLISGIVFLIIGGIGWERTHILLGAGFILVGLTIAVYILKSSPTIKETVIISNEISAREVLNITSEMPLKYKLIVKQRCYGCMADTSIKILNGEN